METESYRGPIWAVPVQGEFVPIDRAEVVPLLSAASGLTRTLWQAKRQELARRISESYLGLQSAESLITPISVLHHVSSPTRSLPGVCLTDSMTISVEHDSLNIPISLIRRVSGPKHGGWRERGTATVELIDGSIYKAQLESRRLKVLTLLGVQSIDMTKPRVTVRGHTVNELVELRARIRLVLESHCDAVVETIGPTTFEAYFRHAA